MKELDNLLLNLTREQTKLIESYLDANDEAFMREFMEEDMPIITKKLEEL